MARHTPPWLAAPETGLAAVTSEKTFLSHWAGPGPGRTTRRQVSWLTDQGLRTAFPARPVRHRQWHSGPGLPAYSCGHSAGFVLMDAPTSLLATGVFAPEAPSDRANGRRESRCQSCPDQKSSPCWALIPAWKACLISRISLTVSAYSISSGFASRPVRITRVLPRRSSTSMTALEPR